MTIVLYSWDADNYYYYRTNGHILFFLALSQGHHYLYRDPSRKRPCRRYWLFVAEWVSTHVVLLVLTYTHTYVRTHTRAPCSK